MGKKTLYGPSLHGPAIPFTTWIADRQAGAQPHAPLPPLVPSSQRRWRHATDAALPLLLLAACVHTPRMVGILLKAEALWVLRVGRLWVFGLVRAGSCTADQDVIQLVNTIRVLMMSALDNAMSLLSCCRRRAQRGDLDTCFCA